jgi:hypothetical protein
MATLAPLTQTTFSALTASIRIDDIGEVGELQNISIEETFDVRPLQEVGSNVVNTFIPGVFRGILRAQRGVLDLDTIYQKLLPISDVDTMKDRISVVMPANKSATFSLNGTVEDIFNSTIKNNRLTHTLMFSVEIRNQDGSNFMKFEDCMINSRRISVNVNQVLILQDIEMVYRKRSV